MININRVRELLSEKPKVSKSKRCKHCDENPKGEEYVMLTDKAWKDRGYQEDENACFSCMDKIQVVKREEIAMVYISISPLTLHLLSDKDIYEIAYDYRLKNPESVRVLMESAMSLCTDPKEYERLCLWGTGVFNERFTLELALTIIHNHSKIIK